MTHAARPRLTSADFDEDYYMHHVGRPYRKDEAWLRFFTPIADLIVSKIRPRRMLDAGCGPGLLVELLRDRGVEAYGFDISEYAIAHVPESVKPYCWQASVADEITERYDLILCQEVFPHVQRADADAAIANFCRHADDVLFSCPLVVDPNVPRHVNFSSAGHFARIFAESGFLRDLEFDASAITPWAMRFRRTAASELAGPAVVERYEDLYWSERVRADLLQRQLVQAHDRMANMERSWFWRLRKPWSMITGR